MESICKLIGRIGFCIIMLFLSIGYARAEEVTLTTVYSPNNAGKVISGNNTGQILSEGDTISTSTGESAIISLNKETNNLVYMEEDTKISIDEFWEGGYGISQITLDPDATGQGEITVQIEKKPSEGVPDPQTDFVIETPTATIGVRGTKVNVKMQPGPPLVTEVVVLELSPGHSVEVTNK